MNAIKKCVAVGLTMTAVAAGSVASASAAPAEQPYEPQGQFKAFMKVYPHNQEAALGILANAAAKNPEEAMKFLDSLGGDSISKECRQDIANCTWDEILEF